GRFGATVARLLADGLATFFRGIAATPSQRIGHFPLWPPSAGSPTRTTPGQLPLGPPSGAPPAPLTSPHHPGHPTRHCDTGPGEDGARIDRLFAEVARSRPDHVAFVDAADGRALSYAGLAARAAEVAGVLAAHGVRRGDFVGVALARSADLVVAILGVLTAGAAYVPLDPGYPAAQLATMIDRSGVKLVIGGPRSGQLQSGQ